MLRGYQENAVGLTRVLLQRPGVRGVCLVSPTGSGKTEMGKALCNGQTLWLTHTKELVKQTAERLGAGIIAAGHPMAPGKRVYVASVQTIVARGLMPLCDTIIIDEFHHFVADEWKGVLDKYPFTPRIGLTATPERPDGLPLSEVVDELVVAATYRELTEWGYLAPVRLLRPSKPLDKGVAIDPVKAYLEKGEGRQGFIYCKSVKAAYDTADQLKAAGVSAACIEANTPADARKLLLELFKAGEIAVLTNMNCLTEGVDVPSASVCILASSMGHVSTYLQRAGRVLRAAPGKADALVIDLCGVSHYFGPPNENRVYALDGESIRRATAEDALRVCMHCGFTFVPANAGDCPRCGKHNPRAAEKKQRVYNVPLHELYSGPNTPDWVKAAEREKLEDIAKSRGLSDAWVAQQFKARFMELPQSWERPEGKQRAEFQKLAEKAKIQGYNPGWAMHRFKAIYGKFPPREWSR